MSEDQPLAAAIRKLSKTLLHLIGAMNAINNERAEAGLLKDDDVVTRELNDAIQTMQSLITDMAALEQGVQ
jgi:hypothetical protein